MLLVTPKRVRVYLGDNVGRWVVYKSRQRRYISSCRLLQGDNRYWVVLSLNLLYAPLVP